LGRKSNYLAKKILDFQFSGVAYTPPATYYFGILVDTNSDDQRAAGTFTEVASANGYARVAVTNNATNFPGAVLGTITLNGASVPAMIKNCAIEIRWPTATGPWGTARGWAIFDGSGSGANMLEFTSLDTPQAVVINNSPYLDALTGFIVSER
jgi:hypothetical protein